MTQFIESFTTQQLLPPWISNGARFWCFVLQTSSGRMQDYLDTHFNAPGPLPSPYFYQSLDDEGYGMLMVADHPDFSSGYAGVTGWDTVAHKEIYWSFPANRFDVGIDNLLRRHKPVWIQPFYFGDSSSLMLASREIWGSEKQLGTIALEEGDRPGDLHIDLTAPGFPVFSPRSHSKQIGVMHIRLDPSAAPVDMGALLLANPRIAKLGGSLLAHIPLATPSGHDPPNPVEINTLKQFRDVFDMRVAAYRSIIASQATHRNVRDVHFYRGEDVSLDFLWSDTMSEQFRKLFGLEPPRPGAAREEPERPLTGASEAEWDLPRLHIPVAFGVSFTSDPRFDVLGTLHTY